VTSQTPPNKPKRVIRRSKSPPDDTKLYFSMATHEAIVKYQKTEDKRERERIYITAIMPAFEKLAENLINIYRFSGLHDTYDELKSDCVCFLFETIGKFDASRGTKAFAYFNVVAKNWLIVRSRQKSTRAKRTVSFDDPSGLTMNDKQRLEELHQCPSLDEMADKEMSPWAIPDMLEKIRSELQTDHEIACIDAIITIFQRADDLDILNKRATLLYMRELSGLTQKQMMTAMQTIKKKYKYVRLDFLGTSAGDSQ